jgi:hypothetical protein
LDLKGGIEDTGGRIPHRGFQDDLLGGHLGQLFQNKIIVAFIGQDQDVPGRDEAIEAIKGFLDQGLSRPQHIVELFGILGGAYGPKAGTYPSGH